MMGYAAILKNGGGVPSSLGDVRRSIRGWLS
jgi:hypothetical protein